MNLHGTSIRPIYNICDSPHTGATMIAIRSIFLAGLLSVACFGSTSYSFIGVDTAGQAVNALVTFNLTGGTLTVTMQNLISNEQDVGQAISGLKFNLAGLSANPTETGTATTETVAANGSTTLHTGTSLVGWTATTSLSAVSLSAFGTGQPDQTILGAPNSSGVYSNANSSIAGNSPHNDFTDQIATFTFTGLTGVNTNASLSSLLSNIQVGFGTNNTDYLSGTLVPTPEPTTWLLSGFALCGIALTRRKSSKAA